MSNALVILLVHLLVVSVMENDKVGPGTRNTGEGRHEFAIWMMAVRNGITEKVKFDKNTSKGSKGASHIAVWGRTF